MNIKTLQLETEYGKLIFSFLCAAGVALVLGYMYFVNATVIEIVARKNIEEEITEKQANVAKAEAEYFTKVEGITLSLAPSYGLEETADRTFVSSEEVGAKVLSLQGGIVTQ